MKRNFKEALKHRRSYYSICSKSPITDQEIEKIVMHAVKYTPSAFNSQTSRLVLLLHEEHILFWEIVKETLRSMLSQEIYKKTEAKINYSFASGYGTVLFFEDTTIVEGLKREFPTYQDRFPIWSQQTSGMHQIAVWTMLEDAGFGASLQHYNPLIDKEVMETWKLPPDWELIAQMPFGLPVEEPGEKQFNPLQERIRIFK